MSLCVRVCVSVYVQIATYNHLLTSPIQSIIYSMITELGFRLYQTRGGTKLLIFHVTCAHTNACHHGCVPHTVTVLKLKNRGIPKGSLA